MPTSYDELQYRSLPRRQSHPAHLATIAALHGVECTDPRTARVLEIGCASGGNILPLACALPSASFTGVDLSSKQIGAGNEIISTLKLANIELLACGVEDFAPGGEFDYIICHGVLSWVTEAVRLAILELCRQSLSPGGLAYISYNTLPGWHYRSVIRDMMLYKAEKAPLPSCHPYERVSAALEFLRLFASDPCADSLHSEQIARAARDLPREAPEYVFHEYLETENRAFHFHEFDGLLDAHGLRYVGDAHFGMSYGAGLPPALMEKLSREATNRRDLEQLMDFASNRAFRESVCCRAERAVSSVDCQKLAGMYISSQLAPARPGQDPCSGEEEVFSLPKGGEIRTADPLVRAAFTVLAAEWPGRIIFPELFGRAGRLLPAGGDSPADAEHLLATLFSCYQGNLIQVDLYPAPFSRGIPERPRVTSLARYQAARGELVTSLRHHALKFDEFTLQLLPRLTGQRSRGDLVKEFAALASKGQMVLEVGGKPLSGAALEGAIGEMLEFSLGKLAREGFFSDG